MATISKESLAQFWLQTIPCSNENFEQLLQFNDNEKIFRIIKRYIKNPLKTTQTTNDSKRTTKIERNQMKFTINIEVFKHEEEAKEEEKEEEEEQKVPEINLERSIDNLSSILHDEIDTKKICQYFEYLLSPWLIDVNFSISNEIFILIIDLMNKYPREFFLHCFLPWLNQSSNPFCSNLFTQLIQRTDQCQLCIQICENSTIPLNTNQLNLLTKWFDSKEFYFSNDLFNLLPNKLVMSSDLYADSLFFAKLVHKILLQYTDNKFVLTSEQHQMLKQTIERNTSILSDILLDLLD